MQTKWNCNVSFHMPADVLLCHRKGSKYYPELYTINRSYGYETLLPLCRAPTRSFSSIIVIHFDCCAFYSSAGTMWCSQGSLGTTGVCCAPSGNRWTAAWHFAFLCDLLRSSARRTLTLWPRPRVLWQQPDTGECCFDQGPESLKKQDTGPSASSGPCLTWWWVWKRAIRWPG